MEEIYKNNKIIVKLSLDDLTRLKNGLIIEGYRIKIGVVVDE